MSALEQLQEGLGKIKEYKPGKGNQGAPDFMQPDGQQGSG
jgi:hypothetical protein